MKNIQLLNKIAKIGTERLGENYTFGTEVQNPDGILVRSADMQSMEFGPELRGIARAGAGVNNIPLTRCAEEGIVVFNTPGANANAVKELTICALLLASRNIAGGIDWAKGLAGTEGVAKAVEAGKSKFAGCEIKGKTLGVIGLGAIGALISSAALSLGIKVVGCDPFLSEEATKRLSEGVERVNSFDDVFAVADYITLHVPSTPDTKGLVNEASIAKMKDGVRIVNLARADLINASDLKAAIASGKVAAYVTDFPTEETVGVPGIVAIPHLGASTEEAEDNCAIMAVDQLKDFLENGNILNSVNYPNVSLARSGNARVLVLHKNNPEVLPALTAILSGNEVKDMASKTRGDFGASLFELDVELTEESIAMLKTVDNVIRVEVL